MAKKRLLNVVFPPGGMDRKSSYRQSQPYTTFDCNNVWLDEVIEGRERGGSRPGLIRSYGTNLVESVRMMEVMTLNLGQLTWQDTFAGGVQSPLWSAGGWSSGLPTFTAAGFAKAEFGDGDLAATIDVTGADLTRGFGANIWIEPDEAGYGGDYKLFFRHDWPAGNWAARWVFTFRATGQSGTAYLSADLYGEGAYEGEDYQWRNSTDDPGFFTVPSYSVASPGLLSLVLEPQNTFVYGATRAHVYWRGQLIYRDSWYSWPPSTEEGATIYEAGFEFESTLDTGASNNGSCLASGFSAYFSKWNGESDGGFDTGQTAAADSLVAEAGDGSAEAINTMLVVSAAGELFRSNQGPHLEQIAPNLTLRDDTRIIAAQNGQKLWIADYGDLRASAADGVVSGATLDSATYADWTTLGILTDDDVCVISAPAGSAGTFEIDSVAAGAVTLASSPGDNSGVSFRIERGPKVFDPDDSSLSLMVATAGEVPTGCPLVCRHLGRIMLGGAEIAPAVWYASKQNAELNWDYAETGDQRAIAGTSSDMGIPGTPLTAMLSHSDDYVIFGCRNEIWRMRGDPALSGGLDALSYKIGIIDKRAWCIGPTGELIFLSANGIYVLAAGGESKPIQLSVEVLPRELLNVDPSVFEISLEFDVLNRGVLITLSPRSGIAGSHWWLSWEKKAFWPFTFTGDMSPTAICFMPSTTYDYSRILLGGTDGFIRNLDWESENDDGTNFTSYIDIGPIPLAQIGSVGRLLSMEGVVAESSGDITWGVYPALTFEAAASATTASETGTWIAGLNALTRPVGRGQAFMLRLTGTAGAKWAFEGAAVEISSVGRRRIS